MLCIFQECRQQAVEWCHGNVDANEYATKGGTVDVWQVSNKYACCHTKNAGASCPQVTICSELRLATLPQPY